MGDEQSKLHALWHRARTGTMTPWTEAKAWALREIYRENNKEKKNPDFGVLVYVAAKLRKKCERQPPSAEAVRQLYQKMDEDPQWTQSASSNQ